MKLSRYMKENKLTDEDVALALGATISAVGKWRRGERMPRPGVMQKILLLTTGAVSPNDFHAPRTVTSETEARI